MVKIGEVNQKFILYVYSRDITENRRHIHVFWQNVLVAKIWIETKGEKHIEINKSSRELKSKDKKQIIDYIDKNYKTINEEITKFFRGVK